MAVFFEALRNNDIDQIYELAQGNDINEVVTYGGYVQTPLILSLAPGYNLLFIIPR